RRGGEQEAGRAAGARRRGRGRAAPRAPPRPRGPADADAIRLRTAAGATAGRIPVTLIQRRAGHHITWAAGAARLTARRCALRKTRSGRALSSAGERSLHTGEVVGSIPTAPTRFLQQQQHLANRAFPFPPVLSREQVVNSPSKLGEN